MVETSSFRLPFCTFSVRQLAAALLLLSTPLGIAYEYKAVQINDSPGIIHLGRMAISESGTIAGSYDISMTTMRGFILADGDLSYFDNPIIGNNFWVMGVNDSRQVLLYSHQQLRAEVMHDGSEQEIWYRSGYSIEAWAINNSGVVAGTATVGFSLGFMWQNGTFTLLNDPQGPNFWPRAIDENNALGGYKQYYYGQSPGAARWVNGVLEELRPGSSYVFGMNNVGSYVGGGEGAFYWRNYQMIDIPTIPGQGYSYALDVNDSDVVVGISYGSPDVAFRWTPGGYAERLIDLIDPSDGWTSLERAYSINNRGQIVGWGYRNGLRRPFLLNPVPEPVSGVVLGASVVALIARRKRRP